MAILISLFRLPGSSPSRRVAVPPNNEPPCHGAPILGNIHLSIPLQPAVFQAARTPMLNSPMIGFILAVPASIKFQFINPPKKAEIPVKMPNRRAIPTATSPMATNLANHTCQPMSSINWMKTLYQSYAIAGLPSSGITTIRCQKPSTAAPLPIQASSKSLCQPEFSHLTLR